MAWGSLPDLEKKVINGSDSETLSGVALAGVSAGVDGGLLAWSADGLTYQHDLQASVWVKDPFGAGPIENLDQLLVTPGWRYAALVATENQDQQGFDLKIWDSGRWTKQAAPAEYLIMRAKMSPDGVLAVLDGGGDVYVMPCLVRKTWYKIERPDSAEIVDFSISQKNYVYLLSSDRKTVKRGLIEYGNQRISNILWVDLAPPPSVGDSGQEELYRDILQIESGAAGQLFALADIAGGTKAVIHYAAADNSDELMWKFFAPQPRPAMNAGALAALAAVRPGRTIVRWSNGAFAQIGVETGPMLGVLIDRSATDPDVRSKLLAPETERNEFLAGYGIEFPDGFEVNFLDDSPRLNFALPPVESGDPPKTRSIGTHNGMPAMMPIFPAVLPFLELEFDREVNGDQLVDELFTAPHQDRFMAWVNGLLRFFNLPPVRNLAEIGVPLLQDSIGWLAEVIDDMFQTATDNPAQVQAGVLRVDLQAVLIDRLLTPNTITLAVDERRENGADDIEIEDEGNPDIGPPPDFPAPLPPGWHGPRPNHPFPFDPEPGPGPRPDPPPHDEL